MSLIVNLPSSVTATMYVRKATLSTATTITADMWETGTTGTDAATLTFAAGTPATLALNIEDLSGGTAAQEAGTLTINAGSLDLAFTGFTSDNSNTYTSFVFKDTNDEFTTDAITKVTRSAAGVYAVNNAGVTSVTTGSVLLTGTTTGAVTAGTKTITTGAAFTASGATVSAIGTISGVANGANLTVTDSGTANTTVTTAALAIGNAVTINGNQITFTGAAQTGVTISAYADGVGVASLTNVASGTHLAWGGAPAATKSMTVNNSQYMIDSTGAAPQIEVTASGTTLTVGTALIGTNRPSAVNTTQEGISIGIQGGTAEVQTAAATATNVNALTMGSTLTAYAAGIDVVTAAAGTKETGSVTVNGTTYYQGFDSTNAVGAMSFLTTATGSRLTNGDAYLNGSGSIVVCNTASGATSTITSTSGDITISTNGTTITIADLDNDDSFTVTENSVTKTYTVSNGVLFDSDGNTRAIFDASDPTFGNVAVTAATNIGALTTTAAFVTNATAGVNWNSSHGSLAPTLDVTGRNLRVDTDNTVVAGAIPVAQYANNSYLHANGVIDTKSTDSLGVLGSDSEGNFTYAASSTRGQSINLAAANDTGVWNLTGTSAGDRIVGNGTGSTLNGAAGNDTIFAGAGDIALGGEGNDGLTANAAGATLSGGAGNDTLTAFTAGRTTLTGGDGSDVFVINDGTARFAAITDFDFANDVLYDNQVAASSNFASLTSAQVFADGRINLNNGIATVQASNGSYLVQVRGNDTKKQAVGWAGEEATSIDATSLSDNVVLIGDTNTAGDSLYGGSGADTIRGGAGDTVYGGAGKNQIRLTGLAAGDATRTVGVGTGKDTITGFVNGFDAETADKLFIVGELNSLSSTLSGGTLNLKSGDAAVQMNAATAASGGTEVLAGDKKAVFVASGSTVTVGSASYADLYIGTKTGTVGSALNASAIEDAVSIDLSNTNVFKNFTQVTGGQGNTTMIGGKDNETLIAGTGSASLYGGAGKDSLVGNSTAKDTFFMLAGGGSDTVSGFTYYNGDNSDVADVVNMSAISSAKAVSGGVQLNVNDTDKILISGANANSAIGYQVGDSVAVAKVGSVGAANSFTYLKDVNYYGGGNKVDTLSFASGDSDNHQVWLDGSQGVTYASVDVVNGASASGDLVIAGDSAKNTIIGGTGNNSLWGGSGDSADTLRGGTGTNTFFYGLAEGNDTITCGTADDVVNLYNVKLSDVKSGEITNSVVSVELQDGSKLTVNTGSRDIKFNLASGESYTANHSTHNWDA